MEKKLERKIQTSGPRLKSFSLFAFLIISTDLEIVVISFIPVLSIMGLPNETICLIKGILLHSPEPIL